MIFKLHINEILQALLKQEDTDGDKKITKDDHGPKSFSLKDSDGNSHTIKGTYHLSNLLQELALAKNQGLSETDIPLYKIEEKPTDRISRMIREVFWDDLTRTIDEAGIANIVGDDKADGTVNRVYVPFSDTQAQSYYNNLKDRFNLEVITLPKKITPEYVKSINTSSGILSLKLENGKGVPFVVPGGRFNEMYGWDSYFEGVGLLLDNRLDLAKGMVDNFCYQIQHYGKILNANRSYYLTRTQPPFLSSFIREVFEHDTLLSDDWLKDVLEIAIIEYQTVWMVTNKRLTTNGLNRYYAEGIGIPPETEDGHFKDVLEEFAHLHGLSEEVLVEQYQNGRLSDGELDTYFLHDRSVRESGHDTSYRLDNCCADLNTVDLNSLLYKYETDFQYLIDTYFNGRLNNQENGSSDYWKVQAKKRKALINVLLWNTEKGMYSDYNVTNEEQTGYESASNFYPLWASLCNEEQAEALVNDLMTNFKCKGGISGTSKIMAERIASHLPKRQWDYPNGWAPHQMMIWRGLMNYGYEKETQELVYRWLWMITINAVDYNGTIPEKYDVVACTHKVYAEYGNVGTEFDYITTSGFGWMNASYQYGLSLLSTDLRLELDRLVDPSQLFVTKQ